MEWCLFSKTNDQIKVVRHFGRFSVWVGGFQQSGPLVEKLWEKALGVIARSVATKQSPKNVLILGLGCGSVIKPLRQKFPDCHIAGVEIDPIMIDLGKKYFNIDKIANLKIICVGAKAFLRKTKEKFDLVLVDMYVGSVSEKQKIVYSKLLNKNGIAIINHLEGLKNRMEFLTFS